MKTEIHNQLEKLFYSIASNILIAERSYSLYKEIGSNATWINSNKVAPLFWGSTQHSLLNDFIIAVARIYDSNIRFNIHSLFKLLEILKSNKKDLPPIMNRVHVANEMREFDFTKDQVESVIKITDEEITSLFIWHFERGLEGELMAQKIRKLKSLRDKELAHSENTNAELERPSYKDILELVDYAKKLLGVVAWAYTNTVFSINGEYRMTPDALVPQIQLAKLFKKLQSS
jgi:hypothetical protein